MTGIFSLEGRNAIVTGASRGLGQAIALALAQAGADVAVTARDASSLQATAAEISMQGRVCHAVAQDVRDIASIPATLDHCIERLGQIDILVNNAGVEQISPALDVDEALWDAIVDTNLKGAFFWSQAVARKMAASGDGGSIVNLCSLTSFVGIPTAVPYTSSKSGLLGMTRALAAEWAPSKIRVNAVAPGYIRTVMTDIFYQDPAWQERMRAQIPQGRFGQERDVGGAVVFLCCEASSYITGHCIPVDGGFLASI